MLIIRPWAFCKHWTHCKKTLRLITQLERKTKTVYSIFTNIYFSSRPDFTLHCHTFFVSALGKQLYMGLCLLFTCPTNMYTYTLYIYNIYMPTSQKETICWTNKNGRCKNITERRGRTFPTTYAQRKDGFSRKNTTIGCCIFTFPHTECCWNTTHLWMKKKKKKDARKTT